MAPKIVYTDNAKGELEIEREILAGIDGELIHCDGRDEIVREHAPDADAIIVSHYEVDKAFVDRLRDCKVITRTGIGVDNVDVKAATANGIYVTNVPDYCIPEVSDHVLSLLLTLQRNTSYFSKRMAEGDWEITPPIEMRRLSEQRLGLLAFGDIPQVVAKKASALGMDVSAYDPFLSDEEINDHGVLPISDLETLLTRCDVVSVHVPLTDDTKHMLGYDEFETMKDDAFLINTSRGGVIDEGDLERALEDGLLGGVGLDVFEDEPTPRLGLLRHEAVVATPHVAFKSVESERQQRRTIAWNVRTVLEGSVPENAINGDRLAE